MKNFLLIYLLMASIFCTNSIAQEVSKSSILNVILKKYYKNEKPVYKNRRQLLYFYCDKPNNNQEMLEAVKKTNLPKDFLSEIKQKLKTDNLSENWSQELNEIFVLDKSLLSQKINNCQTLENYHCLSKKTGLNNQRLMIVSKPIFYSKHDICIVKITFYRNIEHNNGLILLLEKIQNSWVIKEEMNAWET